MCNAFGIAKGTLSVAIRDFSYAVINLIGPSLIKFPLSKVDILSCIDDFVQKFNMTQVLGCGDGSHIPIAKLRENSQEYFRYKQSVNLP